MTDDWKNFLDFIVTTVGDSPHCCDDETMEWFYTKVDELKEILRETTKVQNP